MIENKLTLKWLEKLQKGENINITDLYVFSKIKLKRNRMRKKFNKHYERYVSNEIMETYWSILFTSPLINTFKKQMDFKLDIKSMNDIPNIKLIYPDFKYKINEPNSILKLLINK